MALLMIANGHAVSTARVQSAANSQCSAAAIPASGSTSPVTATNSVRSSSGFLSWLSSRSSAPSSTMSTSPTVPSTGSSWPR